MKQLRIGLIGCGFMGRAHSNAYRKVGNFFDLDRQCVLQAVCARDAASVKAFALKWGFKSIETDWRKLIARDDIDAIDICTPNNTHAEIATAAAKAGKMVLCEKPLSMNGAEGRRMVAAVEKARVPNIVWYNYRRVPAVTLAKQLIDEGRLGRIFHYRAKFLQDWTISPELPQGGAGTEAPGEELGLALGHRALNTGRRIDAATLEVVRGELRRVESGAEQDAMCQCLGQRPMGVKGRAANGQGGKAVHVGYFAGLGRRFPEPTPLSIQMCSGGVQGRLFTLYQ